MALHAAALDNRIAGIGSFASFTPMRTDTSDRPTGGLRRISEMHALLPRLGAFVPNPSTVPYDYDELITSIAPRPVLLYTPKSDRDATFEDVSACVTKAAKAWVGAKNNLTHEAPNGVTKFEIAESTAAIRWLNSLS